MPFGESSKGVFPPLRTWKTLLNTSPKNLLKAFKEFLSFICWGKVRKGVFIPVLTLRLPQSQETKELLRNDNKNTRTGHVFWFCLWGKVSKGVLSPLRIRKGGLYPRSKNVIASAAKQSCRFVFGGKYRRGYSYPFEMLRSPRLQNTKAQPRDDKKKKGQEKSQIQARHAFGSRLRVAREKGAPST